MWSKQIVERASILTIYKPRVKENTKTPRGGSKEWGAAIECVSTLNRSTLSYAPAMAAAMLEYKAKELGIRCDIVEDMAPGIAVGKAIVAAGKTARRIARKIRRTGNDKRPDDHPSID